MTKKKFIIIPIIVLLLLSLLLPVANADNETNTNADVNAISTDNNNSQNTITTPQEGDANNANVNTENQMKKGDVYIAQNDVTIDYIVDGNVFILGNNVTITSQIGGDVFVCAKNVTISEQAYIFSNLFVLAENVNIKGIVYDLYSIANNITIDGYIYRDIKASSSTLNINGVIGRNAYIGCEKINFAVQNQNDENGSTVTNAGLIAGDLTYSSSQEISIPEKAVSGKVNFEQIIKTTNNTISTYLISLGSLLVIVLVVWGLSLLVAPKFLKSTNDLIASKKIFPVLGCGILTPIAITVLAILLLFINITASISLLLLTILALLFALSTSVTIIAINNLICKKLKISKNIGILGILILTTTVLWAICLIPFVGGIISILAVIIGMGLITYFAFNKNKDFSNESVKNIKKEKSNTDKKAKNKASSDKNVKNVKKDDSKNN